MEDSRPFIDRVVAPTKADKEKARKLIKAVGNYGIMAMISIVSLVVVPFVAGGINGDFRANFPNTEEGWIFWWIMKMMSVLLNVFLLALFDMQAEENSKDDEKYIAAKEMLLKNYAKNVKRPISPAEYRLRMWVKKGTGMVATTIITSITIGALILNFDIVTFIASICSLISGLSFGYIAMRQKEIYWTEEYYEYAKIKTEKQKEKTI